MRRFRFSFRCCSRAANFSRRFALAGSVADEEGAAVDNELEAAVDNEPEAAGDNELEAAVDNELEAAVDNELEAVFDDDDVVSLASRIRFNSPGSPVLGLV